MTEKTGLIYLQKDKFQLYSPYLQNILEFRFVPEISLDFDLFNKPAFENLLKAFIVNNKIPAGSFIIVIADNASFIKDFALTQNQPPSPVSTLEDLRKQANEFIDHMPFEEVAGKAFPLPNGIRAYGTNKEMFDGIKSALEKQGFIVEMVIPGFIFGQEVSAAPTLNINIINVIFQKTNLVKEYNLLTTNSLPEETVSSGEPEEKESQSGEVNIKEKKENKKLVLIIGISAIALIFIITGVILYLQFTQVPNGSTAVNNSAPKTTIAPKITQIPALAEKNLNVQILSASESATANTLKAELVKYGFKSVEVQTQQNLGASSSLLIFSEKVSAATKASVTTDVRKIIPNIIIQEKNESTFDIVIIIAI